MEFGKFIAHRGLHGNGVPENSMLAYQLAIDAGLPIELDVRLTKDAKVVVHHDKTLNRMCGVDKYIKDMTYDEIKEYTLAGTDQHIPLFKDVLKFVNGRVPLLVEIKRGHELGVLEKRTDHLLKQYKGEYAVQSFHPMHMLWFRLHSPKTYCGLLVTVADDCEPFENISSHLGAQPFMWGFSNPDFISCDIELLSDKVVDYVRRTKRELFAWTINSEEYYNKAKDVCKTLISEKSEDGFDFTKYIPGK
ncbi:MAG: glycerophosphodiester phosphodiesterase [Ruminococcus sp.]|nr:glycerophosphodiester phosphodiesterase [Ruminococcus sp.]